MHAPSLRVLGRLLVAVLVAAGVALLLSAGNHGAGWALLVLGLAGALSRPGPPEERGGVVDRAPRACRQTGRRSLRQRRS